MHPPGPIGPAQIGPVPAGPAHAVALATIHASAFPPDDSWSDTAIASLLATPGVQAWIDPRGGMILTRLAADEAEILTLAVTHAARRQGIARALLRAATTTLAGQGAQALFLEVSDSNDAARALYLATGFQPAGIRPRYYKNGSNALLLKLTLSR